MKTRLAVVTFTVVGVVLVFLWLNRPDSGTDESPLNVEDTQSAAPAERMEPEASPVDPAIPLEVVSTDTPPSTGVTLSGMVHDAMTNLPVENALVALEGADAALSEARSGADGAFELSIDAALSRTDLSLTAKAEGYVASRRPVDSLGDLEPGGQLFVSFLLHGGSSISGAITDAATGNGIADVSISLSDANATVFQGVLPGGSAGSSTTDADGAYAIDGIAPGSYRPTVVAHKQGYVFSAQQAATISLVDGERKEGIDFQLEKGGVVRGVIRESNGQPLGGVQVHTVPGEILQGMFQNPNFFANMGQIAEQSDAEGRFEIVGFDFERAFRIIATADEYATKRTDIYKLTRANPEVELEIELHTGSSISGMAVLEDGTPVPDHQVNLMPKMSDILAGMFSGARNATTNADGTFLFEHVGEGEYQVLEESPLRSVQSGNFNPLDMFSGGVEIEVDGVNPITELRVVVERGLGGGSIQGLVLTATGQPAAGVKVNASSGGAAGIFGMPGGTATTDEQGEFTLEDLSGEQFTLTVKGDLGAATAEGVALGTSSVTLRLAPLITVSGRVVDDSGTPTAGATVKFEPVADQSDDSFNLSAFIGTFAGMGAKGAQTDDEGYFTFKNMEPGVYAFKARSASKGSGASQPLTLISGNDIHDLTIRLEPGVAIEGNVVDATGAPVSGSAITLTAQKTGSSTEAITNYLPEGMREKAASATTGAEGEFRLDNVDPGAYMLSAAHHDFATSRDPELMASAGQNISGYQIVLTEGGTLTGFALIGGVAKAGTMVQLMGDGGMHMAVTDESGHFEVGTISPGAYMATAVDIARVTSGDIAGATSRPVVVDIVDGETIDVDFSPPVDGVTVGGNLGGELGSITTVSLRIEGGPLPEDVSLTNPGEQIEALRYVAGMAMVGPDGAFDLGGVEPGTYILEAFTMDLDMSNMDAMLNGDRTPQIRQTIEIVAGEPVTLDLEFPPR